MRISGLFEFSSEGNIGGATLAAFNLPTAQALFKRRASSTRSAPLRSLERRRRS